MNKKVTKTKVKNGGKTKTVMVRNPLHYGSTTTTLSYNSKNKTKTTRLRKKKMYTTSTTSTTTTLPKIEAYPYTFIRYKMTLWEKIKRFFGF